ncbi:MAG: TldD/PmbA family protein [Candidatus Melainabacteria bacterium]|nr:TldD/PmbA family protein [Candidatus Melainabacteria bacterium]
MQTELKHSKLEKILKLAKNNGASEAEIIQSSWTENPINFENNKLKTLESNQSTGISIRLIKNKKIGTSSTTDPEALEKVVTTAVEASEFGPIATFELSKENLRTQNQKLTNPELPLENLVERGTAVIEQLKTFHKDLLISGGFNLGYGETIYLNSNGVTGKREKSVYSSSLYAHLVRGEDFLGIYKGKSSLEDFPDEKEISKKIFEKLNFSKENISLETNKYQVFFTPDATASIFGYILAVIFNGKVIQQGISPLVGKLNKELFDKKLTFIEDPGIGVQKADFDDEGIKTQRKTLIKNGVINSFYFDLSSGSKLRSQKQDYVTLTSTGNGFKASLSTSPTPELTSVLIEGGKTDSKDIIKNIKDGIIIDQVLGAGQSNTLAGEFNVGIDLGFKVKDGNIQGRIKNCMIAGNIFEVLKNIQEISSDREWVGGAELFPGFLIESLTVAGK